MPKTNYLRSKNDICDECGCPLESAFFLDANDAPRCRACLTGSLKHGGCNVYLSRTMLVAFYPADLPAVPVVVLGCEPSASPVGAMEANNASIWPWDFMMTGGGCSAYSLMLPEDLGSFFVAVSTVDGSSAPLVGEACVVGIYESEDAFGDKDPLFFTEYPAFYPIATRDAAFVDFAVFADSQDWHLGV